MKHHSRIKAILILLLFLLAIVFLWLLLSKVNWRLRAQRDSLTIKTPNHVISNDPINTGLFDDINYRTLVSSRIYGSTLNTDVTRDQPASANRFPRLEAYIINNTKCAAAGQMSTYRLLVRNTGEGGAKNLGLQVSYPDSATFQKSQSPPAAHQTEQRLLNWYFAGPLPPSDFLTYDFVVKIDQPAQLASTLLVSYSDMAENEQYQTVTAHTIKPCPQ